MKIAKPRRFGQLLLTAVALLFLALAAFAVAPFNQTTGTSKGTSNTPTCSFSTAPAKNDVITVAFYVSPSSITVSAPSDTLGNSFIKVSSKTGGSTITFALYVYSAVQSFTAGADTITLHFTGTVTESYVTCWEASGITVGGATAQTGAGTYTSGTSVTLSTASLSYTANHLVYALGAYQPCGTSGTPTYTSAFTSMKARGTDFTGASICRSTGSVDYHVNMMDEYLLPSSSSTTTASIGSGTWASSISTGTWGWAEISIDYPASYSGTVSVTMTFTPSTEQTVSQTDSHTATLTPSDKASPGQDASGTLSFLPTVTPGGGSIFHTAVTYSVSFLASVKQKLGDTLSTTMSFLESTRVKLSQVSSYLLSFATSMSQKVQQQAGYALLFITSIVGAIPKDVGPIFLVVFVLLIVLGVVLLAAGMNRRRW
jgi:hypothetical protein